MQNHERRAAGARRLLAAVEDYRQAEAEGRPYEGPLEVGCGGKGCFDMTCPYCCESFADPEDMNGGAAVRVEFTLCFRCHRFFQGGGCPGCDGDAASRFLTEREVEEVQKMLARVDAEMEDDKPMEVVVAEPMTLLPPAPDKCQVCATEHEAHLPHNQGSLFYSFSFNMQHGRSPTWTDAAAHCTLDVKTIWFIGTAQFLKKLGKPIPEDVAEFLRSVRRGDVAVGEKARLLLDAHGEGM